MADEQTTEEAFDALRSHLRDLPEGMDPRKRQGPIDTADPEVVESIRVWLDRVYALVERCGAWIQSPPAGRGLDSAWLRRLAYELKETEKGRREYRSLSDYLWYPGGEDLGYRFQPYAETGYYAAKFRGEHTPGGLAGLLEDDKPDIWSQLRGLAAEHERDWIDSGLPPRHGPGPMHLQTEYTAAQNELEGSIADFERDCGLIVLRAIDDLRVPHDLRKEPEFASAVAKDLQHGASGRGVFQWLCQCWLPGAKAGYGGADFAYPGTEEDDRQRFNIGVRVARCAAALAEALSGESVRNAAISQLAAEAAAERRKAADSEARRKDRYDNYFSPYDAVWLDLLHLPCNPAADEPLDPRWLLERLTTLATRARSLDEFDGGSGCVDHLRWLPDCEVASRNRITKVFAIAIAAAADDNLTLPDCEAVCGMLTKHPSTEMEALYRSRQKPFLSPETKAKLDRLSQERKAWLETPEGKRSLEKAEQFGHQLAGTIQATRDRWKLRYGEKEQPPVDWNAMAHWKGRLGLTDAEIDESTAASLTALAEDHLDRLLPNQAPTPEIPIGQTSVSAGMNTNTPALDGLIRNYISAPLVMERCLERDARAIDILTSDQPLHRIVLPRLEQIYWGRKARDREGRTTIFPRVWTHRDERLVNLQRGFGPGIWPDRRASRFYRRLRPRTGLPLHEAWFQQALDEARRQGTAGALTPKLDAAREAFDKLLEISRHAIDLEATSSDYLAGQVELGQLVCDLMPWASPEVRHQAESKSGKREAIVVEDSVLENYQRRDPPQELKGEHSPALDSLKPSERKAWATFKLAETRGQVGKTDREVHDWLDEQDDTQFVGDLFGYSLPPFDTWARYIRTARKAADESKHTPRAGRSAGLSVVKQSDL